MKILITAGATWVKVDEARILTNRFTGKTGLFLARELKNKGHKVTLLINPHCTGKISGVKAVYYRYLDEFVRAVDKALEKERFDMIIHTAAVSDYKLKSVFKGKIPSNKKELVLKLIPSQKVIKRIRRMAKKSLIVQFKLEAKTRLLCQKAYKSLKSNKSDYVVANSLEDLKSGYKAFLIDKDRNITPVRSRKALSSALSRIVL